MQLADGYRGVALKIINRLGIRWVWLAKEAGIDRAKLSRWKNGHIELTKEEKKRIFDAIDPLLAEQINRGTLKLADVKPPSADYVESGKALAERRTSEGISQAVLAQRAKVSRSALSFYEIGYSGLKDDEEDRVWAALAKLIAEKEYARDNALKATRPQLIGLRELLTTYDRIPEPVAAQSELIESSEERTLLEGLLDIAPPEIAPQGRKTLLSEVRRRLAELTDEQKAEIRARNVPVESKV